MKKAFSQGGRGFALAAVAAALLIGCAQQPKTAAPAKSEPAPAAAETAPVAASSKSVVPAPAESAAAAPKAAPFECGKASYYAAKFTGRPTASGVAYDPAKLTAAHKTLPFGTKLKVARAGVGSVVVTVNDRGPFTPGRIIDLSGAAADAVDLKTAGVAEVCITKVDAG